MALRRRKHQRKLRAPFACRLVTRPPSSRCTDTKYRVGEIGREVTRLNATRTDTNGGDIDRQLIALDREQREIVALITPLRRECISMRRARAEEVRSVLDPAIKTAAVACVSAALELRSGLSALAEIRRALSQHHADEIFMPMRPDDLEPILARLGRLAGRSLPCSSYWPAS
jgi:hypothetical protein